MTRNPSRFEYVESVQKHDPSSSSSVVQRRNEETNVVSYIRHENNMIDLNLYPDFPSSCRFGRDCHYVHDPNAKTNDISNSKQLTNSTDALLVKILEKLELNDSVPSPYLYLAQPVGPVHTFMQPVHTLTPPPVSITRWPTFYWPSAEHTDTPCKPTGDLVFFGLKPNSTPHSTWPQQAQPDPAGSSINTAQATMLPHAFNTGKLHDPVTSAWNMNTALRRHQRLGLPGREVLRLLFPIIAFRIIREKPRALSCLSAWQTREASVCQF
ncbi:hypothetical protein Tco_0794615 [Tanacetum coccineum]